MARKKAKTVCNVRDISLELMLKKKCYGSLVEIDEHFLNLEAVAGDKYVPTKLDIAVQRELRLREEGYYD